MYFIPSFKQETQWQTIIALKSVVLGYFNLLIVNPSLSNTKVFMLRCRDECERKDLENRELYTPLPMQR